MDKKMYFSLAILGITLLKFGSIDATTESIKIANPSNTFMARSIEIANPSNTVMAMVEYEGRPTEVHYIQTKGKLSLPLERWGKHIKSIEADTFSIKFSEKEIKEIEDEGLSKEDVQKIMSNMKDASSRKKAN
ncbi:hypothetical protein CVU75_03590 [Candidatus Dependentiae bacterium HGW-Dependentiae-1]|nr:MAG: hypothetical protein CVU75_03590 [Candidatus Dependentiae bacterium HGW-Dependentiae-1]